MAKGMVNYCYVVIHKYTICMEVMINYIFDETLMSKYVLNYKILHTSLRPVLELHVIGNILCKLYRIFVIIYNY